MKNLLFITFGLFCFTSNYGQSQIVEKGEEYILAVINRDFEKVISMTYSDLVKLGGGNELMIKDLYTERQSMVDSGIDYVSGAIGKPGDIIETNQELQTIIPVSYILVMDKKEVDQASHLLAISKDSGQSWSFLDISKYNKESLKTFIPSLSDKLIFPE